MRDCNGRNPCEYIIYNQISNDEVSSVFPRHLSSPAIMIRESLHPNIETNNNNNNNNKETPITHPITFLKPVSCKCLRLASSMIGENHWDTAALIALFRCFRYHAVVFVTHCSIHVVLAPSSTIRQLVVLEQLLLCR